MITSNIIEKKPLSNAKKDNILNNFCELFEGSNEAYTIARTVQGKTNQKKFLQNTQQSKSRLHKNILLII